MLEKIRLLSNETQALILKTIIPALVAISIKIAIQAQQKKISIFMVVISFITGIGSAYLFSDLVMTSFSHEWVPIIIAVITISGEKIGYYFIYKFNVEKLIDSFVKSVLAIFNFKK